MTERTLRDQAVAALAAYDRANPMRTADWHGDDCDCFRCEMDRLRAILDAHTAEQPAPDAVAAPCPCICHTQKGITHVIACCDQPPFDAFAKTSAVPQIAKGSRP